MGLEQLKELTEAVSGTLEKGLAPIRAAQTDQAKALEGQTKAVTDLTTKIGEIEAKVTELEKRPAPSTGREVIRVDANGRIVQLFRGTEGEPGAPAVLRSGVNNVSKPLSVTNILRGVLGKDMTQYASEEMAYSQRLRAKGYRSEFMGSLLFPLGEELFPSKSVDGEDYSEVRKEAEERLTIPFDRGEIGWLAKRYPDFAARMFGPNITKADMMVSDDSLGGALIPPTYGDRIIDLLRNRLSIMRAGATELTLPPSGNITWVRLTEDPAPSYGDPDTTTDATAVTPKLDPIRLQARGLKAWVSIPNDLIRYSSPSVELLVRMALAAKFSVAEDAQFLAGVGSSIAPKGLINYPVSTAETPAIGKITLHVAGITGNDGDTFAAEDVATIIGLYYLGNDPDAPTGWLMRPTQWAGIMNRRADALTANDNKGPFLFWTSRGAAEAAIPDRLAGYPVFPTAQVGANRVKGNGTTLTYAVFGNFRRVLIGRVGTMELAVSEHIKFLQDKLVIRAVERHDMALEHEESFVFTDTLVGT